MKKIFITEILIIMRSLSVWSVRWMPKVRIQQDILNGSVIWHLRYAG